MLLKGISFHLVYFSMAKQLGVYLFPICINDF